MGKSTDSKPKESFFKKYGVLTALLLVFMPLFLFAALGNIAELHPIGDYTDAGVHTFVPKDITSESRQTYQKHRHRTSRETEYDVIYESTGSERYQWADNLNTGSITQAQEVVDRGEPVKKRVFTIRNGSYVVDDADRTPADYVHSILAVNGALALGCIAVLAAILGPWIKKNFLDPDAPAWTIERVQKGSALWLMIGGFFIGASGLIGATSLVGAPFTPFLPNRLAHLLFESPASKAIFICVGVCMFALGTTWSNRYTTDENDDAAGESDGAAGAVGHKPNRPA